ncbi:hypothetical protein GGD55_004292 [Rhizobium giardinii]|uniref:Uncharacterized protein n=1 Tax=Rhizobium giardinii TaxID=56731 RepID=A0A7W8XAD1_9HYPH|nr:hypothetical protein [Rhizobium giardinii]
MNITISETRLPKFSVVSFRLKMKIGIVDDKCFGCRLIQDPIQGGG